MSRVVYLHVGAPKTGTTYLQDRLALNRSRLGDHGVHYPLGLRASQFRPALDLIDMSWGGERENVRGEWDALVGRIRRHQGTVIVSHEILAAATAQQVGRAMSDLGRLGDTEVHVVLSVRDIARQVPAAWQESVKHRRRLSFAEFVHEIRTSAMRDAQLWFWRVQSLPDVLARWGAGLPPERVHLVTIPQPGAPAGLLWERFRTVFGINDAWAPADSVRENPSIGVAETTVLRRLNNQLRQTALPAGQYRQLVRTRMVEETLAKRPGQQRATLSPDDLAWADEVGTEWVEWVDGAGVDVVGDLGDLRPAPPPEGQVWRDPDRPDPAEVADAAVDALAAMTLEAARRPDPDEQFTAKLGRAARRLRGR